MQMSVLYYSKTENTKKMAAVIAQGMHSIEGVEAKSFPIDSIDETWLQESKCVVLGTPIYLACACAEAVAFLQGPCRKYGLAGKIGGAFATADYVHGGGELGIRTILDHMNVLGMLTYSGGGAYGKPVIHLGPVAIAGKLDESKETFNLYGQRMASITKELF